MSGPSVVSAARPAPADVRNRLAILGPSTEQIWGSVFDPESPIVLTSNGQGANAGQTHAQVVYWLEGALELAVNGGVTGNTSADILGRVDAFIAAAQGRVGWILCGTLYGNDFGSIDVATSLANCKAIYDRLDNLRGVRKIACTITNRDDGYRGLFTKSAPLGGGTMSSAEYVDFVRRSDQLVRDYVRSHDGWLLVDYHRAVTVDHLYKTTSDGRSTTADGTHPNHNGGDQLAREIAKVVKPHVHLVDPLALATDDSVMFGDSHFLKPGTLTNEISLIGTTGVPDGGTFTISVPSNVYGIPSGTTAPIPWNAFGSKSADTGVGSVEAALEAVWGVGNFAVTGNSPNVADGNWYHFITWQGVYAGKTVPILVTDGSLLTKAGSHVGVGISSSRSAAGGAPTGWATANTGFATTLVARDDGRGYWCRMEALQDGASVSLNQTFGVIAAGVVFRGEAELRVDDTWRNPVRCDIVINPQVPVTVTNCWQLNFGISPAPLCFNPGPSQGPALTPWVTLAADTSGGTFQVNFQAGLGSVLYVGRVGIRKYVP